MAHITLNQYPKNEACSSNSIQLLTFVSVDMKCYWKVNFILTDAKRRSIWIVYCSITLHVHGNKNQQLFYYIIKSIFQLKKSLLFSRFNTKFGRHDMYLTNHATLRRYVTDYATLLEATSSSMRHQVLSTSHDKPLDQWNGFYLYLI